MGKERDDHYFILPFLFVHCILIGCYDSRVSPSFAQDAGSLDQDLPVELNHEPTDTRDGRELQDIDEDVEQDPIGDEDSFDDADEAMTCRSITVESPVPIGVRASTGGHYGMDLVWMGDSYGLAWQDNEIIRYRRLAPDGSTMGREAILIETDHATHVVSHPRIAWTGSMVGVTWEFLNDAVQFQILFPDGEPEGPYVPIDNGIAERLTGIQSAMAWTGENFAAAWPFTSDSYLDTEGIMITSFAATDPDDGESVRLYEGNGGHPDVQGHDGRAAVVWQGEGIHFTQLSDDGTLSPPDVVSDPYFDNCYATSLAVGNSGFGVIWNLENYELQGFYFRALSFEGERLTDLVRIDERSAAPYCSDIAWFESWYAVVWVEYWTEPDEFSTMHVAMISETGEILAEETITENIFWWYFVAEPHLAWTGSELGMIWRSPYDDVVLSRIRCTAE
jgi:hypothetical protein